MEEFIYITRTRGAGITIFEGQNDTATPEVERYPAASLADFPMQNLMHLNEVCTYECQIVGGNKIHFAVFVRVSVIMTAVPRF